MGYLWTGFRAAVYGAGFVLGWYFVALSLEPIDDILQIEPPRWIFLLGIWFVGLGGILALICVSTFVHRGQGTLAPFDPPRLFVASGPYRVVRNPMYVGGLMVFLGFGMMERSIAIMGFALILMLGFHFFVKLVEEPVLERRFGPSYLQYKQDVPRWFPRAGKKSPGPAGQDGLPAD